MIKTILMSANATTGVTAPVDPDTPGMRAAQKMIDDMPGTMVQKCFAQTFMYVMYLHEREAIDDKAYEVLYLMLESLGATLRLTPEEFTAMTKVFIEANELVAKNGESLQ